VDVWGNETTGAGFCARRLWHLWFWRGHRRSSRFDRLRRRHHGFEWTRGDRVFAVVSRAITGLITAG
jgi:hypothetical protein